MKRSKDTFSIVLNIIKLVLRQSSLSGMQFLLLSSNESESVSVFMTKWLTCRHRCGVYLNFFVFRNGHRRTSRSAKWWAGLHRITGCLSGKNVRVIRTRSAVLTPSPASKVLGPWILGKWPLGWGIRNIWRKRWKLQQWIKEKRKKWRIEGEENIEA